ncbi:unnamed protein product [Lathyrus sativus]|nr:unnamed protein product [Lathyrus sativus]
MKLNDVRLRYAIKSPGCRDFKAHQLASQIVEDDSSKKYGLLWSYGVDLRKASSEITSKLNINCPTSGLQPRDPNDQYLPLIFRVVENETKDSLSWFIKLIMEDIGETNRSSIFDQER